MLNLLDNFNNIKLATKAQLNITKKVKYWFICNNSGVKFKNKLKKITWVMNIGKVKGAKNFIIFSIFLFKKSLKINVNKTTLYKIENNPS